MSGNCYRCGQGLGFFASGEPICTSCKPRRDASLQAWCAALDEALADRVLYVHEELRLRQYQVQLGLWDQEVAPHMPRLQRAKTFNRIALGALPIVQAPMMYQRGEVAHLCVPATLMEERTHREYQAGSRGVSIRIMKGVSIRAGSARGHYVPVSEIVPISDGNFIITSERTIFTGSHMVTIPHKRIIGYEAYTDGLRIDYDGRRRPQYFRLHDGEYAAAVLSEAAQAEEVRPTYGQSAYVFSDDDHTTCIPFYPDEAHVARMEELLKYGDERSSTAFLEAMPNLAPGTIVDVGNVAGITVAARPQSGPLAGRWGFVLFSYCHLYPMH